MLPVTLLDWVGVLGSFTIAGGYLAVTRGWVDAKKPAFNLINLLGAAMILTSLWEKPNSGAILIEILWSIIAVTALVRWLRAKT